MRKDTAMRFKYFLKVNGMVEEELSQEEIQKWKHAFLMLSLEIPKDREILLADLNAEENRNLVAWVDERLKER